MLVWMDFSLVYGTGNISNITSYNGNVSWAQCMFPLSSILSIFALFSPQDVSKITLSLSPCPRCGVVFGVTSADPGCHWRVCFFAGDSTRWSCRYQHQGCFYLTHTFLTTRPPGKHTHTHTTCSLSNPLASITIQHNIHLFVLWDLFYLLLSVT